MSITLRAYISLGSNLGQPLLQVKTALKELEHIPDTKLIFYSSFYRSKPFGIKNQPDFINAVGALDTLLSPEELLNYTQVIERNPGYMHKVKRWGPRLLDLDIILYANQVINTDRLTVPHYDLKKREFMLYPLAEIAPNIVFPDGELLSSCLKRIPKNGMIIWSQSQ